MKSSNSNSALLMLAAVALIALNLRPFITGIGPLAAEIGLQTGLDLKGMSLLTLVPMFLMGIFAFAGPFLQARVGARRSIIGALVLLIMGSCLRLVTMSGSQLVVTAALLGLGAAVVQAVLPGLIKRDFPRHMGFVMGLYSAMLMGGGAFGAQVSPLVAKITGSWHMGLAWMALPATLALILATRCLPRYDDICPDSVNFTKYMRKPRVWLLMVCFGLVNGGYSTVVAWLASFYQEHGWSITASGSLLAIMAVFQALAAFIFPILAGKKEDRRPWLWLTLAMQGIGFSALAFWPETASVLWVIVLGMGLGGCFALSLIVALEHLSDPAQAGAVSALMQGGGFLIAAMPPWIIAVVRDSTGEYTFGWLLHLGCVAVVTVLYFYVSPSSYASAMNT